MVANQAFHRALENGAYLNAHFLCCFGKYLLIMECYGADEMYLAMLIIVLHDVPFQESLETVQHQRAHARLVQILSEEWRQLARKRFGKGLRYTRSMMSAGSRLNCLRNFSFSSGVI